MDLTVENHKISPAKRNYNSLQESERVANVFKSHYFHESAECSYGEKKVKLDSISSNENLRLDHSFFKQPCITLAKSLLGKIIARKLPSGEILKGMIVETESYLGVIDEVSHSFNGKRTDRNEAMYLNPGTAYVYSIYGMYYCFNISSLEDGSAVLIRALEPLEGFSSMQEFRSIKRKVISEIKQKELCNGPSKLCQAFKIEKNVFNKVDLCSSEDMWLEKGKQIDSSSIISCKRIGIDSYGKEWANKPLRFYVKGNICVSRRCKSAEKTLEKALLTEQ